MKLFRGFTLVVFAFCLTLSAPAQEKKFVVVSKTSKELKRTAARLRLPVEQVKSARHALQEATDLTERMDPYPTDQIHSLANSWLQLNRSKAEDVIESFIKKLRSQAYDPVDIQQYRRVSSTAQQLIGLLAEDDYEYTLSRIQNWPDPPASFGDAAQDFRKNMEAQARQAILSRMMYSNPEKALDLLAQLDGSETQNSGATMMVIQMLMNAGKREEGLRLIDQTIGNFAQSYPDQNARQNLENFIRMTASYMDSDRMSAAMDQLLEQLTGQEPSDACNGKLEMGDTSMDLTCAESTILSLVPNLGMRPELIQRTLNSIPGLKSKLNAVGGIDNLYSRGGYGSDAVKFTFKTNSFTRPSGKTPMAAASKNPAKLLRELKGKAESNPVYTRRRLRGLVEDPQDVEMLIRLASMAAYQDADLGALALDIARQFLTQIEPLQKRSTILQQIIRTYRRIEGESDTGLLREGYILADQLRQEQSRQSTAMPAGINLPLQAHITPADRLEIFLISEFARDSFESALQYINSMEEDAVKLVSLIRIVQVLSRPNY